ncbi:IS110 family transposase [Thermaerobacter subterraneus]|uniref:Transposase n=1 Tax=Thermaerobacter subterraneus DSM 13965 TaxID=867903 RepID=K6Q2D3_9FIRM|nr:IS110 family transposase [Thermaerobacter subterraneus]EKP95159.1 transposase [Thermaerobacter subterraneus DSM 13965]
MPRYFGLDLHKRYVHGYEWQVDQHKGRHFRFPNTEAGWATFVQQLHADDEVALEVTGNAFAVHDLLSPHAGKVLLTNPLELKRLGPGRHTDRKDAERRAKTLALGMMPAVWVPPPAVREVRYLLQYRDRLVRNRRRYRTQAKSVLQRHGLPIPWKVDPRQWLDRDEVNRLPQAERVILLSAIRQLEAVDADLHAVEAEIARQVADQPGVQLLLTITGVGLITAVTIWAYLGDPTRFRTAKQVTRYAGLDASVHQSGEQDHRGRISRNGSKLLRTALVEAAHAVARHDQGPFGEFFHRKQQQIGHHKAVVALARKLLIVAWRMLLTGQPYRAAKPTLVAQKQRRLVEVAQAVTDWDAVAEALWPDSLEDRHRRRRVA